MTVKITLNGQEAEYTLVVTGDLLGNGEMGFADALKLARYKAGLDMDLNGAYLLAADVNNNGSYADDIDLLKMVRVLAGLDAL